MHSSRIKQARVPPVASKKNKGRNYHGTDSGSTSTRVYFDLGNNYSVTHVHLYQSVFFRVQITKYRKMLFLSVWNRTNPYVGSASNLNAPKGSIPIKKVEKHWNIQL